MKIFNNEIYKGGAIALISKSLAAACTYIMTIYVARTMDLETSGFFFLSITIIFIFASLVRFGAETVILKRLSIYFSNFNVDLAYQVLSFFVKRIVFFSIVLNVFLIAIYLVFIKDNSSYYKYNQYYLAVLLSFLPISLMQLSSYVLQAKKHMFFSNLILSGVFPFFLIVFLFFLDVDESYFILKLIALPAFFSLLFSFFIFKCSGSYLSFYNNLIKDKKELVSESYSMFPIVVLNLTITWLSQILLGLMSTPSEVAGFAVSQRTAMLLGFLILAANSITSSKFSDLFDKKDYLGIQKTLFSSIKFVSVLSLPLIIIIIIFNNELLLLFGEEYIQYKYVFLLICLSQLFNVFTGSVGQLLQMSNNQNKMRKSIFIALLLNTFFAMILIPKYGALGAACAYSLSFAVQNVLCAVYVYKVFKINILFAFCFKGA